MKRRESRTTHFAVCVDNRGYHESGEDYLYSADRFVDIEPPQTVRRSLLNTAKAA